VVRIYNNCYFDFNFNFNYYMGMNARATMWLQALNRRERADSVRASQSAEDFLNCFSRRNKPSRSFVLSAAN